MQLDQESAIALQQVKATTRQGKLEIFPNGSYKYTPSPEYTEFKKNLCRKSSTISRSETINSLRTSMKVLQRVVCQSSLIGKKSFI